MRASKAKVKKINSRENGGAWRHWYRAILNLMTNQIGERDRTSNILAGKASFSFSNL